MDNRTRVLKPVPARTMVMKTPPKMTAIMEAVSREVSERPALGVTRMPTPPNEDESNTDKTSLFIRRPPARPMAPPSNMATRMVFSSDNPPAFAQPPKGNNRQPRLPMPPSGGFASKKRSGTKEITRGSRILKPVIAVAVLAVVAVAILSQRSENIAVAAGPVDSSRTESVTDDQSQRLDAPSPEPKSNAAAVESKPKAQAKRLPTVESIRNSETDARPSGTETEADAASLLLSGHRREALAIYQRLASRPNSSSGVQAMSIVLQQKVETP